MRSFKFPKFTDEFHTPKSTKNITDPASQIHASLIRCYLKWHSIEVRLIPEPGRPCGQFARNRWCRILVAWGHGHGTGRELNTNWVVAPNLHFFRGKVVIYQYLPLDLKGNMTLPFSGKSKRNLTNNHGSREKNGIYSEHHFDSLLHFLAFKHFDIGHFPSLLLLAFDL